MTSEAATPFELGRQLGSEDAAREPLTEEQERKVRVLLRDAADSETPTAKAS